MGHLSSFIAIIGGEIILINLKTGCSCFSLFFSCDEQHLCIYTQPELPLSKLVVVIQNARKYNSYEYTHSTKGGSCIEVVPNPNDLEYDSEDSRRADQNSLIAIDARIPLIKDAIKNYQTPARTTEVCMSEIRSVNLFLMPDF